MNANLARYRRLVGLAFPLLLAGCTAGASLSPVATERPPSPEARAAGPSPSTAPTPSASTDEAACVSLNIDYVPGARGKDGNPVDLARTDIAGLRTHDVVEGGTSPEPETAVQIVRAGEVIGSVMYVPDGSGRWLLVGGWLCAGLAFSS